MKRQIKFNMWNFLDVEDINDMLDDDLLDDKIEGVASDITHKIVDIDSQGNITVASDFILEKI